MDAVIKNKDKLIVHATITGYGGGVLEPKVPSPSFEFAAVKALISHGFPKEKIVIRVDPVIPTNKGLAVAYRRVLRTGMKAGFSRYRISVRDNNRKQTYNGLLFLCIKSYTRSHV